jgi:hypothetical protein
MKNPAVLETLQKYRSGCCPVNRLNQQDFHKKLSAFSDQPSGKTQASTVQEIFLMADD